jgi:hypothetical protein
VSRASTVTIPAAARHPASAAVRAITGRKTSCPVAFAAEKMPVTSPRCVWNQRFATTAPSTSAIAPVPTPMSSPHSSQSCHGSVMSIVSPLAAPTTTSAHITVRRTPQRSMTAAANGAVRP